MRGVEARGEVLEKMRLTPAYREITLRYPPRDKVLALGRALEGEALFDTPRIDRLLGGLMGWEGF